MTTALLSIRGICKAYAVSVLNGIDIEVYPGEVHAVMGANGAGKTTLCNIICGLVSADSGEMLFRDIRYSPASLAESAAANIRMVMQELKLIDNLTIAENMFLSNLPNQLGFVDFNQINRDASHALLKFGLQDIDPRQKLHNLGIGQKQLVEIAQVLIQPCDLLILDEPTAALTEPQVDLLFAEIQKLKEKGTAIIYVSHRMDEIKRISDRVTVLRDGIAVASEQVGNIDNDEIIKLMTGSSSKITSTFGKRDAGLLAMQIENLSTTECLEDISLDIYYGEILGIAGLMGSGRTELLRAIYGADPPAQGCLRMGAECLPLTNGSPQLSVKNGIGLICEDRKQQGLLLEQSVKFNISLASLDNFSGKLGWINSKHEDKKITYLTETLALNFGSNRQIAGELSGGNQQKVVIARWLLKNCQILLFDEPTRGIDIQTKHMIYALLNELAQQGKAIVVVSSETSELLSLSDRIAIMSNGKLAEIFQYDEWSPEKIMSAAFRHYSNSNAA